MNEADPLAGSNATQGHTANSNFANKGWKHYLVVIKTERPWSRSTFKPYTASSIDPRLDSVPRTNSGYQY